MLSSRKIYRNLKKQLFGEKYRQPNPKEFIRHFDFAYFQNEDFRLLRDALSSSVAYGEYGSGASTVYVVRNFSCSVKSIESDRRWSNAVNKALQERVVEYVNLGAVGKRGRPVKLGSETTLRKYPEALFENNYQPDCVLIDGRFRVACFLQTLISSAPGTTIIFDDYPFREQYHVVEDFAQKEDATKTQAMFIRPEKIDVKTISAALAEFIFVPD